MAISIVSTTTRQVSKKFFEVEGNYYSLPSQIEVLASHEADLWFEYQEDLYHFNRFGDDCHLVEEIPQFVPVSGRGDYSSWSLTVSQLREFWGVSSIEEIQKLEWSRGFNEGHRYCSSSFLLGDDGEFEWTYESTSGTLIEWKSSTDGDQITVSIGSDRAYRGRHAFDSLMAVLDTIDIDLQETEESLNPLGFSVMKSLSGGKKNSSKQKRAKQIKNRELSRSVSRQGKKAGHELALC